MSRDTQTVIFAYIGALAVVGYAAGLLLMVWAIINDQPWNAQHFKCYLDGRMESFADHPLRNTFAVFLNALLWPVLALRAFIKEL